MAETFPSADLPVNSYMFNVYANGVPAACGYAVNPFEGKPETFKQLADMMSRMWVAFIHNGNPNHNGS
ncbi:Uu.00g124200.m01.CDS01 [Anthostomella pinea]|uniref:Uu.00g124200.m01.CDS01 n=1 Tax=Anthostomella pinea TaxID=933095 RepID=A0AAI8YHL0_9PEZI|nr:Uu.00g124200.m01.CDS01 [Anthostomella pinea]